MGSEWSFVSRAELGWCSYPVEMDSFWHSDHLGVTEVSSSWIGQHMGFSLVSQFSMVAL